MLVAIAMAAVDLAAFYVLTSGCLESVPSPEYFQKRAVFVVFFSGAAAVALIRGIPVFQSGRRRLGGAYFALAPLFLSSATIRLLVFFHSCGLPP